MAYDEDLSDRYRDALEGLAGVSEKRMMGGLCFLLDGNMIGGADRTRDGAGRFMFRVGKHRHAEAMARTGAAIMEMGGRRMSGMIFVDADTCSADALKDWMSFTLEFTATLPPK